MLSLQNACAGRGEVGNQLSRKLQVSTDGVKAAGTSLLTVLSDTKQHTQLVKVINKAELTSFDFAPRAGPGMKTCGAAECFLVMLAMT